MGTRSTHLHFAGLHYEPSIKAVRINAPVLKIVRVVWSAYALLAIAITALGIGPAYALYRQMCRGEGCGSSQQLDAAGVLRLQAAGLSLDFYAAYLVAAGLLAVVGCLVFAFILIRSRSRRVAAGAICLYVCGAVGDQHALPAYSCTG